MMKHDGKHQIRKNRHLFSTWLIHDLYYSIFLTTLCSNERSNLANELSHLLRLQGPSFTVDTACSSSASAMDVAYRAIRSGQCDAALVGGVNLLLSKGLTLQFHR